MRSGGQGQSQSITCGIREASYRKDGGNPVRGERRIDWEAIKDYAVHEGGIIKLIAGEFKGSKLHRLSLSQMMRLADEDIPMDMYEIVSSRIDTLLKGLIKEEVPNK